MKTYYCVTSAFYDSGRIVAGFTHEKEADEKPENTYKEKNDRDIHENWFDNFDDAQKFIEETKSA